MSRFPRPEDVAQRNSLGSAAAEGLSRHRDRVTAGLATIGGALQKNLELNLSRFSDHSNGSAKDDNREKNHRKEMEQEEEAERQRIVQEALAKCHEEMEDHLNTFLFLNPNASYEEWIQDLHPENVADGKLLQDFKDVDLRFYVADSDHRLLWNARAAPHRQVAARKYKSSSHVAPGDAPVDLLNEENVFAGFEEPQAAEAAATPAATWETIRASATVAGGGGSGGSDDQPVVDLLGDGWP